LFWDSTPVDPIWRFLYDAKVGGVWVLLRGRGFPMKKVLAVSLLLNGVLILGLLWDRQVVHAGNSGCGTGKSTDAGAKFYSVDTDGSGAIDISDAVSLLNWLFIGGPHPATCLAGVPATGQTKCYDDAGTEIDCASSDFPGQNGFYQTGCPMAGRFVVNKKLDGTEDGTVTDNCTGLMWERQPKVTTYNWPQALNRCADLGLGGYDDWRLPNVRELQSIIDYGQICPAVPAPFDISNTILPSGISITGFWSSTSVQAKDPDCFGKVFAWSIRLAVGDVVLGAKSTASYVLAVRTPR
jgi:hypothetical protein